MIAPAAAPAFPARRDILRATTAMTLLFANSSCFTAPSRYIIDIVDVIVPLWSLETNHNPEPSIAVNPVNPNVIAMSSFYLDPGCATETPQRGAIMISLDRGVTWSARCALPLHFPDGFTALRVPGDVTLAFTGDGTKLLAAYIEPFVGAWGRVVEITGWETVETTTPVELTPPAGVQGVDQPHVVSNPGGALVTVGVSQSEGVGIDNDCPKVVIWWWLDPTAVQNLKCATDRQVSKFMMPIRPVVSRSGVAFGVYLQQLKVAGEPRAHLILVRGKLADPASTTFSDLLDTRVTSSPYPACRGGDGKIGVRLKSCLIVPVDEREYTDTDPAQPIPPPMGNQMRGANQLSIALDPRDTDVASQRVYIAYGDAVGDDLMTLHLVASDYGGTQIDRDDMRIVHNALNPEVAVDQDGRIGFLYQQLVDYEGSRFWETRIQISNPSQTSWDNLLLSRTPADDPPFAGYSYPYLGDYIDLQAVGHTFYGVFSAGNKPVWHFSARYLRPLETDANGTRTLPAGVAVSIDPFFFRITPRNRVTANPPELGPNPAAKTVPPVIPVTPPRPPGQRPPLP